MFRNPKIAAPAFEILDAFPLVPTPGCYSLIHQNKHTRKTMFCVNMLQILSIAAVVAMGSAAGFDLRTYPFASCLILIFV